MAKAIKKVIPAILKPILDKRGFAQAQVILDWEKIVGPQIAQYSIPERIIYYKSASTKGMLVLAVTPGWAPIIMHGKQQILDRINSYFGYEAINRFQLKQTMYLKMDTATQIESPSATESETTEVEELTKIQDLRLRQAMVELRRALKKQ
jgi:hypothetical protein